MQQQHFERHFTNLVTCKQTLHQLCVTLAVKLKVSVDPSKLDQLVEALDLSDFDFDAFCSWFDKSFMASPPKPKEKPP